MNRSIVVTGAGAGIGHAIASRLTADGWCVVGLELPGESASGAEDCCEVVIDGDVCFRASHEKAAAAARKMAPLAGWVNNAGFGRYTPLHALDEELVRRIVDVNGLGYMWGASAAVSALIAQKSGGSIVHIGSIHGRASFVDHAAYEFTKGGVDALSRSVAVTYGRYGIRSNTISPGAVRTPLMEAQNAATGDPEAAERMLREGPPLGRIAEPTEIASVAAFLLSDDAAYLSGQSIAVDGAWTASFGTRPTNAELDAQFGLER